MLVTCRLCFTIICISHNVHWAQKSWRFAYFHIQIVKQKLNCCFLQFVDIWRGEARGGVEGGDDRDRGAHQHRHHILQDWHRERRVQVTLDTLLESLNPTLEFLKCISKLSEYFKTNHFYPCRDWFCQPARSLFSNVGKVITINPKQQQITITIITKTINCRYFRTSVRSRNNPDSGNFWTAPTHFQSNHLEQATGSCSAQSSWPTRGSPGTWSVWRPQYCDDSSLS